MNMKVISAFLTFFFALLTANASFHEDKHSSVRHSRVARLASSSLKSGTVVKRCADRKGRPNTKVKSSSSTKLVQTTLYKSPSSTKISHPTTLTSKPPSPNTQSDGLIKVSFGKCGSNGATSKITKTSGPNGSLDWLNCGIDAGGWTPPDVRMDQLVTKDLATVLKSPSNPFKACSPYVGFFYKYSGIHNIPPIIIASIAMQESSCNPNMVGGAGEQGLMQITKDKCGSAPNGNCKDPDFNIRVAVEYFIDTVNNSDGNVIVALGRYNGWSKGMTYGQATAAAHTRCCPCQNNLDYLHQLFNGWCQGQDPTDTSNRLGKYFNLDICN